MASLDDTLQNREQLQSAETENGNETTKQSSEPVLGDYEIPICEDSEAQYLQDFETELFKWIDNHTTKGVKLSDNLPSAVWEGHSLPDVAFTLAESCLKEKEPDTNRGLLSVAYIPDYEIFAVTVQTEDKKQRWVYFYGPLAHKLQKQFKKSDTKKVGFSHGVDTISLALLYPDFSDEERIQLANEKLSARVSYVEQFNKEWEAAVGLDGYLERLAAINNRNFFGGYYTLPDVVSQEILEKTSSIEQLELALKYGFAFGIDDKEKGKYTLDGKTYHELSSSEQGILQAYSEKLETDKQVFKCDFSFDKFNEILKQEKRPLKYWSRKA